MKRCPLHKNTYCEGSGCALAGDENGNCLIHKLLVRLIEEHEPVIVSNPEPTFKPPMPINNITNLW